MLFMILIKASKNSEEGLLPPLELREAMLRYKDKLVAAGVRVMAKGLHPSSEGMRITFGHQGDSPVVEDGPFAEVKDTLAGFFLIDVPSKEEAVKWAMQVPDPQGFGEGQIELRQVYE